MCILSFTARTNLAYASLALQIAGVVLAAMIVWGGVYIKTTFDEFRDLKYDHLGESFPNFLVVSGVILLLVHFAGFQCSLAVTDWKKFYRNKSLFQVLNFLYLVLSVSYLLVLLIIGVFLLKYQDTLRFAWLEIMKASLKQYPSNLNTKVLVDAIQVEFRCCGATSHSDWHKTPWIRGGTYPKDANYRDYVAHTHKGYFKGPAVPFSCCNPRSTRACINTFYLDASRYYNYHPETDITINSVGCAEAISRKIGFWLVVLGEGCLWCLIVEAVAIIVFRLIQTSAELAMSWGDPTQAAQCYLVVCGVPPVPPGAVLDPEKLAVRMKYLDDLAFNEENLDDLTSIETDEIDSGGETENKSAGNSLPSKNRTRSKNANNLRAFERRLVRVVETSRMISMVTTSSSDDDDDEEEEEEEEEEKKKKKKEKLLQLQTEGHPDSIDRCNRRRHHLHHRAGNIDLRVAGKRSQLETETGSGIRTKKIKIGKKGTKLILYGRDVVPIAVNIWPLERASANNSPGVEWKDITNHRRICLEYADCDAGQEDGKTPGSETDPSAYSFSTRTLLRSCSSDLLTCIDSSRCSTLTDLSKDLRTSRDSQFLSPAVAPPASIFSNFNGKAGTGSGDSPSR